MYDVMEPPITSNGPDDIFFDGGIYESQFPPEMRMYDVPFWTALAHRHGPKVIELACGTGRVTIPVFESGVDIDGLDFSESMLHVARQRAHERSLSIQFFHGDLRALPFKDRYDLMFLPTATIAHLVTRSEVEAFLAGVHKALRPNGVLALDMHNPMRTFLKSWPLATKPEKRSFQHVVTKEMIELETTYEYSTATQILLVKNSYTFADGSSRQGTIVIKMNFPAELQDLLHYNGFEVFRIHGGYAHEEFTSASERYVLLARKRQA